MITLTENARKELEAYFADKEKASVRLYMAAGGCSGPRLALALDEPNNEDKTFTVDGFTFCVNTELMETIGGATVDLTCMGFTVTPVNELPGGGGCGGGGCGGGCSCGGGSCGS